MMEGDHKEHNKGHNDEGWISYSSRYSYKELRCPRCGGKMYEEYNPELPEVFREFACIRCGFRFWIDTRQAKKDTELTQPQDN